MPKKILIFSLVYYPKHIGGAEVAIKEITDRIDPKEIEFHMIAGRYDSTLPKIEQVGNVLVHRIGIATKNPEMGDLRKFPLHLNKFLFQVMAARKAHQLHKKHKYDGTWSMMSHATGIPGGIFKKKHPTVSHLLTLQEGDPPEYIEAMMRKVWPLFKAGFTKADYLQAISTFLLRWGERMGFKGQSFIVPNAVNVSQFLKEVPEKELNEAKKEIGKKEGETWLITTSRLVHKNAVDDVIKALNELPSDVHFLILGTGPDEEMLKDLAKEKGVSDRAHFYGFVDHKKIPAFYKACDIFIRPSRSEGFGNSFVEAMAADIPVIATQEGGISDFLFDEERNKDQKPTGWAVDKDSPTQIAEATKKILSNKEKVKKITAHAKKMVIENYDWDLIANRMKKEIFDEMLS